MPDGQPSDANSYLASVSAGSAGPQQVPVGAPPLPGYTAPSNPLDDVVVGLGFPGGTVIQAQRAIDAASRVAASGGGYRMDVDEMKAILSKWEEVRDELQKLMTQGERLGFAQAPADDQASNGQIQAVRRHAQLYRQTVQQQFDYANEYVNSLTKAISGTQKQDSGAAEAVRRGGQVDQ